jgi:uncharacterized protein
MAWTGLFVITVIFVATLVRSALGFGEALLAVPLLAMVLPVEVAAPLAVLVSITIAGMVLAQDWRHAHFRSAGLLVLSSLLGIPLGLLLLTSAPEALVKALLGVVIMVFAAYSLTQRKQRVLQNDGLAYVFGFSAGILGGAYGMNGPPLVVYGTLRRWSPERFRATLQGYFLPASTLVMVGYWRAGLWVPQVTHYYLFSLAPILVGTLIGRAIHQRMDSRVFRKAIDIGLLSVGVLLLIQALS